MSKVKIELNSPGIRALLRCPEMQAVLKDRADTVKDRCGDGYESYVAPTRAVAVVETACRKPSPAAAAAQQCMNTSAA